MDRTRISTRAALRAGDGSLGSEATVQFFWTGLVLCLVALAGPANRQGRMVLLRPDANVVKVLEMAGIDTLIPIVGDDAAALAAVSAP